MRRLIGIIGFIVILSILSANVLSLSYYFTDRMNFPPDQSRIHIQTITFSGNLLVTLPSTFTLVNYTGSANTSSTNISWASNSSATVQYTLASPASCNEGDYYYSYIYENNTLIDEFVYVCINDTKIADYKIEYGHGNSNYLSEQCISNETATLFNLIRVWNLGHYLIPDEAASNATIVCYFEDHPIRTYGRVEVDHSPSQINGSFYWSYIESGYWFRIGVLSQEISGKSLGDVYNVSCTELRYQYEHEQVIAYFTNYSLDIVSTTPISVTASNYSEDPTKLVYTFTNNHGCSLESIYFNLLLNGVKTTEVIPYLGPGESVEFIVDNTNRTNVTLYYIPSWYANSLNPQFYKQVIDIGLSPNLPPALDYIGNYTILANYTFMLDINASDPNSDPLTFYDNITLFNIDPSTGIINFTPTVPENYSILITVADPYGLNDTEVIWLFILPYNLSPNITYYTPLNDTSIDEGDTILFNITASDPENDTLSYHWYINNTLVAINTTTYNFTTDSDDSGTYFIQIIVSDPFSSAQHNWTITVNDSTANVPATPGTGGGGGGGSRRISNVIIKEKTPEPEPLPLPQEQKEELEAEEIPTEILDYNILMIPKSLPEERMPSIPCTFGVCSSDSMYFIFWIIFIILALSMLLIRNISRCLHEKLNLVLDLFLVIICLILFFLFIIIIVCKFLPPYLWLLLLLLIMLLYLLIPHHESKHYVLERCPRDGTHMRRTGKLRQGTKGGLITVYTCPKCGYKSMRSESTHHYSKENKKDKTKNKK